MKSDIRFGKQLRLCRETLYPHKTQEEVAEDLGIGRDHLIKVEGDKSQPSYDLLVKMVEYYKTSFDFVFGYQPPNKQKYLPSPTLAIHEERASYQPDNTQTMIWLMRDLPEEKQRAILDIAKIVGNLNN